MSESKVETKHTKAEKGLELSGFEPGSMVGFEREPFGLWKKWETIKRKEANSIITEIKEEYRDNKKKNDERRAAVRAEEKKQIVGIEKQKQEGLDQIRQQNLPDAIVMQQEKVVTESAEKQMEAIKKKVTRDLKSIQFYQDSADKNISSHALLDYELLKHKDLLVGTPFTPYTDLLHQDGYLNYSNFYLVNCCTEASQSFFELPRMPDFLLHQIKNGKRERSEDIIRTQDKLGAAYTGEGTLESFWPPELLKERNLILLQRLFMYTEGYIYQIRPTHAHGYIPNPYQATTVTEKTATRWEKIKQLADLFNSDTGGVIDERLLTEVFITSSTMTLEQKYKKYWEIACMTSAFAYGASGLEEDIDKDMLKISALFFRQAMKCAILAGVITDIRAVQKAKGYILINPCRKAYTKEFYNKRWGDGSSSSFAMMLKKENRRNDPVYRAVLEAHLEKYAPDAVFALRATTSAPVSAPAPSQSFLPPPVAVAPAKVAAPITQTTESSRPDFANT